jgi:hypothetical protein
MRVSVEHSISTTARRHDEVVRKFGHYGDVAGDPRDYLERSLVESMSCIVSQSAHRNIADILRFKLELTSDHPRLLWRMQQANV